MRFSGVCLVTTDVPRLVAYYRMVLQIEPDGDDVHASFVMEGGDLAIFSVEGMEEMAPGSMSGAGAGNCVIAFQVSDCDAEHARLVALGVPVVKPPATYPWGARCAWFSDPDGNIVDLYARPGNQEGSSPAAP
jgi:predicted enzyme related to lactoylglutathione lyase